MPCRVRQTRILVQAWPLRRLTEAMGLVLVCGVGHAGVARRCCRYRVTNAGPDSVTCWQTLQSTHRPAERGPKPGHVSLMCHTQAFSWRLGALAPTGMSLHTRPSSA